MHHKHRPSEISPADPNANLPAVSNVNGPRSRVPSSHRYPNCHDSAPNQASTKLPGHRWSRSRSPDARPTRHTAATSAPCRFQARQQPPPRRPTQQQLTRCTQCADPSYRSSSSVRGRDPHVRFRLPAVLRGSASRDRVGDVGVLGNNRTPDDRVATYSVAGGRWPVAGGRCLSPACGQRRAPAGIAVARAALEALDERRVGGDHWPGPFVDGVDDLGVVDPAEVDGRDSQVGVT